MDAHYPRPLAEPESVILKGSMRRNKARVLAVR
jgi:hypothetical protein